MELDIHLNGAWVSCAVVELLHGSPGTRHGHVRLKYEAEYAARHLRATDYRALTVRAPVDFSDRILSHWPSFLIDLLPQGAARRRIQRTVSEELNEWGLLLRGAINPVGNLRVRPTREPVQHKHAGFRLEDIAARGDAFVDYAHQLGATVAGATDTQGDAPKFWVVEDAAGRWHPDSGSVGFPVRRYALLKFPVPEAGVNGELILRHEAAYQRVAQRLGLRVTPALPEFSDGALLIPRFDRRYAHGQEVRLGVESIYSVAGVIDSATTALGHPDALIALSRCLTDFDAEVVEYMKRDLLNIAIGNRDNHGRNTAVLKETDGKMLLAPLYDLGPAFLDARNIVRVMRWDGERPEGRDWNRILENLATRFEEKGVQMNTWRELIMAMRAFADELEQLPHVMADCGVDQPVIASRATDIVQLRAELRAIRVPQ
jgi:serine/threonine-protein kinase HipA